MSTFDTNCMLKFTVGIFGRRFFLNVRFYDPTVFSGLPSRVSYSYRTDLHGNLICRRIGVRALIIQYITYIFVKTYTYCMSVSTMRDTKPDVGSFAVFTTLIKQQLQNVNTEFYMNIFHDTKNINIVTL